MEDGEGETYSKHLFVHIANNVSFSDPLLEVRLFLIQIALPLYHSHTPSEFFDLVLIVFRIAFNFSSKMHIFHVLTS